MTEPDSSWLDYRFVDASEPSCFPWSAFLQHTSPQERAEDDPAKIFVHPQSYFSFDIRDPSLSVSLVPPLPAHNASIRFPILAAFLDSMIATQLEPPIGYRHWRFTQRLKVYIGYLMTYSPAFRADPRVLPNGELEPGHAKVMNSLKAENRHYLDMALRGTSKGWLPEVQERRAILEKIGQFAEASKPLPKVKRHPSVRHFRTLHTSARTQLGSSDEIGLRRHCYTSTSFAIGPGARETMRFRRRVPSVISLGIR
ncbi:hypothetical protein BKA93DRAFT_914178 [Sparassis latifolia]